MGASPVGRLGRVARARAAASGRGYVVPDDIQDIALPVLAHRILLSPEAQMRGASASDVLEGVVERIPVPMRQA